MLWSRGLDFVFLSRNKKFISTIYLAYTSKNHKKMRYSQRAVKIFYYVAIMKVA